jgi:hypothetical protein
MHMEEIWMDGECLQILRLDDKGGPLAFMDEVMMADELLRGTNVTIRKQFTEEHGMLYCYITMRYCAQLGNTRGIISGRKRFAIPLSDDDAKRRIQTYRTMLDELDFVQVEALTEGRP